MSIHEALLLVAVLLNGLVAGLVFAFAVVVMPGLARLGDAAYLRAFRAVDGVIQDNQPAFLSAWLGSAASLVAALVFGWGAFDVTTRALVVVATLLNVVGIQLPTAVVNVPLNNQVQSLPDDVDDATAAEARAAFESTWIRWNTIRTVVACAVVVLLGLALRR